MDGRESVAHEGQQETAAVATRTSEPEARGNAAVSCGLGAGGYLGAMAPAGNAAISRALSGKSGPDHTPDGFDEQLGATTGGGRPIPDGPRERLEAGFGRPLDGVRLHGGSQSAALAGQVGARAFTVGQDVHFGQGQFDPSSPDGYKLLAHEVTHTLQQPAAAPARSPLLVSAPDSTAERQAEQVATAVTAGRTADLTTVAHTPAVVGRDPDPAAAASTTVTGLDPALSASLSEDDKKTLAQAFPQGVTAGPAQPMIIGMRFGTRLDGYRVPVIRLAPVAEVGRGVEAYIMQIGKGRSILVSSIGGGSVLFDAGTGQTTSVNAPSVQRLVNSIGAVTASGVAVPDLIKLSHADTDHYNAARALLQQSAYSQTAVEVAVQQMGAASGGAWTASSLTIDPNQRLIMIDVTGGQVQVNRVVIDNMELTEFRSVPAAQQLQQANRTTFNRNRTSPVVVVRDLVSGQRMLLTADAQGQQFDQIVNAIGDTALRRVLGGDGANLATMEAPHHYGKQAGPDAAGMLNMLQLALESSNGDLRVFAQTTQQFATNETRQMRSFNFLDAIGVAPERVEDDPSGAGESQVTRARGSSMERVTVDFSGVQQAIETIQRNGTALHEGYSKLAELATLRADAGAMHEALAASAAPAALISSVAATDADLARLQTAVRTSLNGVWDQARTAASDAGALRGSADFTGVTQALNQVTTTLATEAENITKSSNDMEAHRAGLSLYSKLYVNALRMIAALESDNVAELHARRAEHTDLVRAAAGTLGPELVHDHVKSAWAATRAEWTPQRIEEATRETSQRMASRQMSAEFRARLGESLSRQIQLNELAAQAEHGGRQVYGPGGTPVTPMSTRVGAGVMAMIEVIRIGLDIAVQVKQANEAAAANTLQGNREGVQTMSWWELRGVKPAIALVKRGSWSGWNVAYDGDQALAHQAATQTERPAGVPEFDKVVVTAINADSLRTMAHRLIAELAALGDWYSYMDSYPPGQALKRIGSDWGILLWSLEDEAYRYTTVDGVAPGLSAELTTLYEGLEKGQQARMDLDAAAPDAGAAVSVKDTAWFGVDRDVHVYDHRGHLRTVDFEDKPPKFLRQATVNYPYGGSGDPLVRVKAADMDTYRRLTDYFWVKDTGQQSMDQSGVHEDYTVSANSDGLAYVEPGHLIPGKK
jgi:beta-lactamase superfamily II metal-dependent hydrolase